MHLRRGTVTSSKVNSQPTESTTRMMPDVMTVESSITTRHRRQFWMTIEVNRMFEKKMKRVSVQLRINNTWFERRLLTILSPDITFSITNTRLGMPVKAASYGKKDGSSSIARNNEISIKLAIEISINQASYRDINQASYLSSYQSIKQTIEISIKRAIYRAINQASYLSSFQSTKQTIEISINQAIYQARRRTAKRAKQRKRNCEDARRIRNTVSSLFALPFPCLSLSSSRSTDRLSLCCLVSSLARSLVSLASG